MGRLGEGRELLGGAEEKFFKGKKDHHKTSHRGGTGSPDFE